MDVYPIDKIVKIDKHSRRQRTIGEAALGDANGCRAEREGMPMLKRIIWILASTFSLIVIVPDVSSLGGAFAFAAGSGSGATAKPDKTPLTQDNTDALSAFMTSPTFTPVASPGPSTDYAGPHLPLPARSRRL